MRLEPERATAVDAQRLERGAAAQQRVVVGAQDRRVGRDDAAPRDREPEQRHAGCSTSLPTACRSGRAFTHDSSISAAGSESQTMPAADPEVDPPLGDGEGADRERELEVAVRPDPAERAHRRAAADGLERRDLVDRRDLRRARDRAARERRLEQLGQRDAVAKRPLDRRDEVAHAGEPVRRRQLGPADRCPARRRARGRCARGRRSSRARRRPSPTRSARLPAPSP